MAVTADIKPVASANFESKRKRKAYRKGLIRGTIANKITDTRIAAQDRAAFYKGLRELKMMRRKIASELSSVAEMAAGLHREIRRAGDRSQAVADLDGYDEALKLAKRAMLSVSTAAAEHHAFSRRRVFYTESTAKEHKGE